MDIPMQVQTLRSRLNEVQAQQAHVEATFRQVVRKARLSPSQRHAPHIALKKSRRSLTKATYQLTQIESSKRMRGSKIREHLQQVDQALMNCDRITANVLAWHQQLAFSADQKPEPPRPENQQVSASYTTERTDPMPEPPPPQNGTKEQA